MKNGIARSPLFYVGDKYKLIREIKTHLPENIGRLIEPFVGGGSVFMNIEAQSFLLNDADFYVMAIHKLLSSYVGKEDSFFKEFFGLVNKYHLSISYKENTIPPELKKKYPKTYFAKFNKEAYLLMKKDFNNGGKKDILCLYALLIYGFNRMLRFNKKGDFNLPVGDVDFNKNTYEALVDYFRLVGQKHIDWFILDFREFLNNIEYQPNDLVYLDPPYLITFSEYNKFWNEDTEHDLLTILDNLHRRNIHFAISNVTHYKGKINNEFLDWSAQYNSYSIKSNYISYNDNSIKSFNEVLVTNF